MSLATLHPTAPTQSEYQDRSEAGRALGRLLSQLSIADPIVLALPRGGVAVGYEVAKALSAPLGLIFVAKIGHPLAPEVAIAAIAEDGHTVYGEGMQQYIGRRWLRDAEVEARRLIAHRRHLYLRAKAAHPNLTGENVIVVDDGIATGLSMKAAVLYLRTQQPATLLIAAPVISHESQADLERYADGVISLCNPDEFRGSVGAHYAHFDQLGDGEVIRLFMRASVEFPQTSRGIR